MASPLIQIKEVWGRLPMAGRIATIAAGLATLGLLGAIIYYGTQPDYGVLFSDLKAEDAQKIVEKLKAENVPYTLANSGSTIQVPNERISELRLQMASSGMISGGHVGFDLFDKTSFGATDFAQQVNYRRAIEGELAKTLEGVDEVESARVHITPTKESVFTEKEEGAKASVMLRIRQGKALSNERTEAVISLISSSVEGLDPSNVSVMDTNGRLLSAAGQGKGGAFSDAGAFHAQLEATQKFEAENNARIIAFLEPIVGEGRVRANISADVDFSQVEQTEEKYNPQSQVVRSQQTSQEARNSSAPAQGTVVGARANDPTTPPPPATVTNTAQTSGDQRTATTTNYEIDRTIKKTIGGGGRINRLTVSVLMDTKTVNGVETPRTADELQKIQELVSAAIGMNTQRGDSVVVQSMPFDKPPTDATEMPFLDRNKQLVSSALKYGSLIVVALLLLMFVFRPARRALTAASVSSSESKQLPSGESSNDRRAGADLAAMWESEGLPSGNAAMLEAAPMMTVSEMEAKMLAELEASTPPLSKEAQRTVTIKKMISDETLTNPETVVGTLRGWLQEG